MKKIVFTFGRMNPPTIGHQKLVDVVVANAKKENADSAIYLSHTHNNKKDPIDYSSKVSFAQKAFGRIVKRSKSKTIIQVVQELEKSGYTDIILVVGSDRVSEFDRLLQKYNGKDFNFDSIEVRTAGQRDPDAQGVEGMSASKLRAVAMDGDLKTFTSGLPKKLQRDAKKVYDMIRNNLEEAVLSVAQRKKKAVQMKKLAPKLARLRKQKAKKTADSGKLQARSMKQAKNIIRAKLSGEKAYKDMSASEKIQIDKRVEKKKAAIAKIAKKLLPKVKKQELERVKQARAGAAKESFDYNSLFEEEFGKPLLQFSQLVERQVPEDPDLKDKEGSQPRKYHTGLKKGTKERRDSAFKRGAKKDSDDPSAYPKSHPGDKDAETKTSKHTLAYRRRFGESITEESPLTLIYRKLDQISHPKRYENLVKLYVKMATENPNKTKGNIAFEITRRHTRNMTARDLMSYIDSLVSKGRLPQSLKADYEPDNYDLDLSENADEALKKKAEKSGISYAILKKVYDRGMAAWRTGHRPGANQQQWAYARVNSFITGGKTRTTADADLWAKHKGKSESMNEAVEVVVSGEIDKNQKQIEREVKTYKGKYAGAVEDDEVMFAFPDQRKADGFKAAIKRQTKNVFAEAVSPAQQAAIAIAKKESGKYDKDGKKKKNEDSFKPHWMYNPETGEKEWAEKPEDHERLDKMGWVHDAPKKTLNDAGGAGEWGTDKLRKKYEKDTPKARFKEMRR